VPCWNDDADLDRVLKRVCRRIFENELSGWTVDEAAWPKRRGFTTFQEWFEVEAHSMVFELGDGFIEVEAGNLWQRCSASAQPRPGRGGGVE
jgi:hypothetical protein